MTSRNYIWIQWTSSQLY